MTDEEIIKLKPGDLIKIVCYKYQRYAQRTDGENCTHIDNNEIVMFLNHFSIKRLDIIHCVYKNSIWEIALNPEDELFWSENKNEKNF